MAWVSPVFSSVKYWATGSAAAAARVCWRDSSTALAKSGNHGMTVSLAAGEQFDDRGHGIDEDAVEAEVGGRELVAAALELIGHLLRGAAQDRPGGVRDERGTSASRKRRAHEEAS